MGNFERLSVLVIVVIIVLIVVIALVQLTEGNEATSPTNDATQTSLVGPADGNGGQNGGAGMNGNGVSIPATPRPPVTPTPPEKKPLSLDDLMKGQPSAPPAPPAPPVVDSKVEPLAAKEEPKVHVVQPGETIAKIAKVYFPKAVTKGTDAILKANPDVDPSRMRVGAKLTIPVLEGTPMAAIVAPTTTSSSSGSAAARPQSGTTSGSIAPGGSYTTKKGDTLASISRRAYGKTERWQDIWLANYDALGDDVDKPAAGIRLKIPR